jgi:glyoxalase superfamily protein
MAIALIAVSYDCADAGKLAQFWAEALGRSVSPGASPERAAVTADDPAAGPQITFHQVPEGKTVKNRLHLDLVTSEIQAESARLLELGATRLRDFDRDGRLRWTTFADPDGNEFDLIAG